MRVRSESAASPPPPRQRNARGSPTTAFVRPPAAAMLHAPKPSVAMCVRLPGPPGGSSPTAATLHKPGEAIHQTTASRRARRLGVPRSLHSCGGKTLNYPLAAVHTARRKAFLGHWAACFFAARTLIAETKLFSAQMTLEIGVEVCDDRLHIHICSNVSIPSTAKPCLNTFAVKSQRTNRLARCSGSAFSTGQFS